MENNPKTLTELLYEASRDKKQDVDLIMTEYLRMMSKYGIPVPEENRLSCYEKLYENYLAGKYQCKNETETKKRRPNKTSRKNNE